MKYFFGLDGRENTCLRKGRMLLSNTYILQLLYLDYTCVCMHAHACMCMSVRKCTLCAVVKIHVILKCFTFIILVQYYTKWPNYPADTEYILSVV